ncbi:MAG: aminotransferase class IV [Pirellulales bacterium]
MNHRVVYFNGQFVAESEARVSIFDSALTYGDMAYEVTRTIRGRPFRLRDHLDRLQETLDVLRIDLGLTRDDLERITLETLIHNQGTEPADVDWQILHGISRGPVAAYEMAFADDERRPTVFVSCFPLTDKLGRLAPVYQSGLALVIPAQRSLPSQLLPAGIKSRSRLHFLLANQQAEALRPGSTALLLDTSGFLTEGTTGNVFTVSRGKLLTPTTRDILIGVTRKLVLELGRQIGLDVLETDIPRDAALSADEIFMTSTSSGILHARSIEGQPVGDGNVGPITQRLRRALYDSVGLDFEAQAQAYAQRLPGLRPAPLR